MKKFIVILFTSLLFCQTNTYVINDAPDYILATLIQLFYPGTDAYGYESKESIVKYDYQHNDHIWADIKKIQRIVENELWWKWYGGNDRDVIDQVIHQEIFKFVKDTAEKIAYKKTKNSKITTNVVKKIIKELEAKFNSGSSLYRGVYKNYIGKSLERRTKEYCNKFDDPYQTPQNLYTSQECCICFEPFGTYDGVERVYLMPCGHDICKGCAQSWFFDNYKNSCPQCRTVIDKNDLYHALYDPSAPSEYEFNFSWNTY